MAVLKDIDKAAESKGSVLVTIWQFVKFIVVSLLAMIVQFVLLNTLQLIPAIKELYTQDFSWWVFVYPVAVGGLGYFIVSNVANIIAQIVAFFVNKEKTFNSGANVAVANSGVMLTGNGSAAEAKSALLLIPQGVNAATTVTIVYDKTTSDGTLESTATVKLSDFKAGGASITEWAMGNRYVYNIIFGANKPIHFSPSIEADWATTTLDYTIQ